jgi:hypothetical protein
MIIGKQTNQAGGLPMNTIPQVAEAMQQVLISDAEQLGRESGFVQRQRKLNGASFIQALGFGFQGNSAAAYSTLIRSAASVGVRISPQGLEQRFTATAASFVRQVLVRTVEQIISSEPVAIPLLQRFKGVYVRDSSVISLPAELIKVWSGVGNSCGPTAALKLQVELNFSTGQLHGPVLQNGRDQDQTSPFQQQTLPAGTLHIADLGYFNLKRLAEDNRQGVYWLTRLKVGTQLYTHDGQPLDLVAWLQSQSEPQLDRWVLVGKQQQVPCRLLAVRVPAEVADQRRRRLREYARKKQVTPSAASRALLNWTLLITNVPDQTLSLAEGWLLYRVRWQIELLFKLWKSHARLDEWRSQKPWRILCELYAKLIGVVVMHWISLTSLWQFPQRSLFQAACAVQDYATALALALPLRDNLIKTLTSLHDCLLATCRINRRDKHPSTFQLLLDTA